MIRKYILAVYMKSQRYVRNFFSNQSSILTLILCCTLIAFLFHVYNLKAASLQQGNSIPKEYSGIHLGNKVRNLGSDWTEQELSLLEPNREGVSRRDGAQWPAMVVVLSNQVYQIDRWLEGQEGYTDQLKCRIKRARIRTFPPDGTPIRIFKYLREASQAGVKVVIRIDPSPGSFFNWDDPSNPDNFLELDGRFDMLCNENGTDEANLEKYRPPADIADEIKAIHLLNQSEGIDEYGFEPANEPNLEWYKSSFNNNERHMPRSWRHMNNYFLRVIDHVNANITINPKVFMPPMAQDSYALETTISNCGTQTLNDGTTGYSHMMDTIANSDGFSWHNYWAMGKEEYRDCNEGGGHVSFHFPPELKDEIRGKPAIITEADLFSVHQSGNVDDKRDNTMAVSESIRHFFYEEYEKGGTDAHYGTKPSVAFWLLNDNTCPEEECPSDQNCPPGVENCRLDHNWHEAYGDDFPNNPNISFAKGRWFEQWYTGPERYPYMGDVNCDGKFDSIDMLFVLKYEVGISRGNRSKTCDAYLDKPSTEPSGIFLKACDVSGDGPCNAIDALFIQRCEVGLPSRFCPAIND